MGGVSPAPPTGEVGVMPPNPPLTAEQALMQIQSLAYLDSDQQAEPAEMLRRLGVIYDIAGRCASLPEPRGVLDREQAIPDELIDRGMEIYCSDILASRNVVRAILALQPQVTDESERGREASRVIKRDRPPLSFEGYAVTDESELRKAAQALSEQAWKHERSDGEKSWTYVIPETALMNLRAALSPPVPEGERPDQFALEDDCVADD